jgi:subtilase family serine protease
VVALPDLVVSEVGNPPAGAVPGGSISVTDTTQNVGFAVSLASKTRYYLSLDPTRGPGAILLVGSRALGTLNHTETSTGTVSVTIPASAATASYHLLACADDLTDVNETNEANNCRASDGKVQVGRPNLVVTFASNPPPVGLPGWDIYLQMYEVANTGVAPAGLSTLRFYLSTDVVKNAGDKLLTPDRPVPALAPGQVHGWPGGVAPVIPANTPLGTYYLITCADALGAVTETQETDNCFTSSTTINVTRPDLVVGQASTTAVSAGPGAVIAVGDTTLNQGLMTAVPSTTRYYLSLDQAKSAGDKLLTGSRGVPALDGGESSSGSVNVTVPLNTPLGTYWLLACADADHAVVELSDGNNCAASAAQIAIVPL